MKYILLIGDGMGDLPIPSLGGKTILEAASTPTMDRLARQGELLLVQTVPDGMAPGSDVANLSLLGYEPEKCYTGRAPLEAAAMGVEIGPEEIAFRCNLVTLEPTDDGRLLMVDYSAGEITSAEAAELIRALQAECGNEQFTFYSGVSYRHLLIWRGPAPELTTVPPHDHTGRDVTAFYQQYLEIPELRQLLEKAEALLAHHPVNEERRRRGRNPATGLWLWGAGRSPRMETIGERYGLRGSLISAVDLLKGLGVCGGLEVVAVEGATGGLDTNYEGKVAAALAALQCQDLVVVHVEAPDEAGHQGRVEEKVQAIEDFDRRIVTPIVQYLDQAGEDYRLVVTMDHYTPISIRTHERWPVPMFIYDSKGVEQPSGRPYTEAAAREAVAETGLSLASGAEFFRRFIRGGRKDG